MLFHASGSVKELFQVDFDSIQIILNDNGAIKGNNEFSRSVLLIVDVD